MDFNRSWGGIIGIMSHFPGKAIQHPLISRLARTVLAMHAELQFQEVPENASRRFGVIGVQMVPTDAKMTICSMSSWLLQEMDFMHAQKYDRTWSHLILSIRHTLPTWKISDTFWNWVSRTDHNLVKSHVTFHAKQPQLWTPLVQRT